MPRVWAALIEQTGSLLAIAAQFVVMQHLYATYLSGDPDSSWIVTGLKWYVEKMKRRDVKRWVEGKKEVELVGS
jgi:hypothetical protein